MNLNLSQDDWNWWHKLDDIWKKIFNAEIGKIKNRPQRHSAKYVFEHSCIRLPKPNELQQILQLEKIEYSFYYISHPDEYELTSLQPIWKLKNLKTLHCGNNHIADLSPLSELKSLEDLSCGANRILNLIPLTHLSNLRKLNCRDNCITDLSPLSQSVKLESLTCSGNRIADLSPLESLATLKSLSCGDNRIVDLNPLSGLKQLRGLACAGNRLSEPEIQIFKILHPNCRVYQW